MDVSLANVQWKKIGKTYQFEGIALKPGTWRGIDGHTVIYTPESIENIKIIDNVVKAGHGEDSPTVGFVTKYLIDKNHNLKLKGYIFKPELKERDLSVEARVETIPLEDDIFKANKVEISAVALVPKGAVRGAKVVEKKLINLAKGEKEVTEQEVEEAKLDPFLQSIKDELIKIGIDKKDVDRAIEVLKKMIKIPYPSPKGTGYPYPYPAVKQEEFNTLQKEVNDLKDLIANLEKENSTLKENIEKEKHIAVENQLIKEIKEVDPEANIDEIVKGSANFSEKKVKLEAYLAAARKFNVTLAPIEKKETLDDVIDRVVKDTFGKSLNEVIEA